LNQDLYLEIENQKRVPIIETGRTKPNFKTKPKWKRKIGSAPLFKTESESETDVSPTHSKYIHNILTRKVSQDPTFDVYQYDTGGSFKLCRSSLKYNNKHVFVDGKRYKATKGLWELLIQLRPHINVVTHQVRQAYKETLLQTNAHSVNYSPSGKKSMNVLKYTRYVSQICTNTKEMPSESLT